MAVNGGLYYYYFFKYFFKTSLGVPEVGDKNYYYYYCEIVNDYQFYCYKCL